MVIQSRPWAQQQGRGPDLAQSHFQVAKIGKACSIFDRQGLLGSQSPEGET